MLVPANLTPEEFRDLHNGLCDIRHTVEVLESVLHPKLANQFRNALAKIDAALAPTYASEDDIFQRRSDLYQSIAAEHNLSSVWGMYSVDDMHADTPYIATELVYQGHSTTIVGDTWVSLWKAADRVIKMSGDTRHYFIEGFAASQDMTRLMLQTGS